jgi:hypothetical protein
MREVRGELKERGRTPVKVLAREGNNQAQPQGRVARAAAKDDLVRIVDKSGEDYLHHKDHFVFVDFPSGVQKKILALQGAT